MAVVNGSSTAQDLGIAIQFSFQGSIVLADLSGVIAPLVAGAVLVSNNDALYFQSKTPADLFAFQLSVAGTNDGVLVYEYWNGSGWTAITPQALVDFTLSSFGLIIGAPLDWATGDGGVTELNAALYSFRIRATTAPTTPPTASEIGVARFYTYREAVESKQALEVSFDENQSLLETGESMLPYFGAVSNDNAVEISWRINP
jgi:hypothetical protein